MFDHCSRSCRANLSASIVLAGRFLRASVSTCVQFSGFAGAIKLSYIINLAWDKSRSGLSAATERQIISRTYAGSSRIFLFSPLIPALGESYYVTSKEDNKWFATRGRVKTDTTASTNIYIASFSHARMTRDRRGSEVQTNFIFEAALAILLHSRIHLSLLRHDCRHRCRPINPFVRSGTKDGF